MKRATVQTPTNGSSPPDKPSQRGRKLFRTTALALAAAGWLSANCTANAASLDRRNTSAQSETTAPVSLNQKVEIDGERIRLGDVFTGAGRNADRVIANAPKPGRHMTLEARWLGRVAQAFNLDWRPQSRFDTVEVTRRSTVVSRESVERQIQTAAAVHLFGAAGAQAGQGDTIETVMDTRLEALHLPPGSDPRVTVSRLEIDPRTDRFSAMITAPTAGGRDTRLSITGQIYHLVLAPVPAERVMRGEIIEERDLVMRPMRRRLVASNAILDISELVGMSAKSTLIQGRLITSNAIEPPILVEKGGLVTVTLRMRNMHLTARAKAMEDGAMNEVIRVMNTESNRSFEVVVTGPSAAAIATPTLGAVQDSALLARR
ncbi:MAG: flagellar basal body P-ring formation chaperone FlgA [Alphaproteobacteria bacterium]|nr:flagellar basal body P-ring formation chaperone FlgA [Alphaproteobacteria bacterium]